MLTRCSDHALLTTGTPSQPMSTLTVMITPWIWGRTLTVTLAALLTGVVLLGSSTSTAAPTCVAPPAGLVSWWPGEGNAQDIVDGNDGLLRNGVTFVSGMVGQALSFDGVDDYVEVASSPTLQFGTGDFTIDFWARILNPFGNAQALITTQSIATDPPGILVASRGISPPVNTIMFDIRDGVNTQTITVPVPTDLQFHYFTFTRSGTDIKGYVDGVDQTTVVNAVGVANMNSPAALFFGRTGLSSSAGLYFAGELDELGIFNRALSGLKIQAIYNAGSAGKCMGPVTDVTCNGQPVTILGTPGPDILVGTSGPDVIHGLGDNDGIDGRGGDDVICGGAGDDILLGGEGNDLLLGGNGDDTLSGGPGDDTLRGGADNDRLLGGRDDDRLYGDAGDDRLRGEQGSDRLRGGAGDDRLHGGPGIDSCDGQDDIDTDLGGCDIVQNIP
jgi:Ca2+-binding RTX toxin-like protein